MTRGVLRRDVLVVCAVAFLCDVVAGIIIPTFSLYAKALGASLVLVGALTTLSALTQLVISVPVGLLSDRIGRRSVLLLGMASFAIAMALFAVAPNAYALVPGRLMLGLAMVSTFWIAAAHLGDIVRTEERGVAFGLLTTSMGIGFAIGPLLGGEIADSFSLAASYYVAAVIALLGLALVWTQIPPLTAGSALPRHGVRESVRLVGRSAQLLTAFAGNLLATVAFSGAVFTFLPIYGDDLGFSKGTIGTLFAVRAVASAAARLPSGFLAAMIGSRRVVVGALMLQTVGVLGMGGTEHRLALGAMLAIEGIAYGTFLTASHAFIAEHTDAAHRGAALGLYSSAGSIGGTLAPFGLGFVARGLGLPAVFFVSAGVLAAGVLALGWLGARLPAPAMEMALPLGQVRHEGSGER